MLISCPNCKSTFAIPAKAVGATGRKVKCSKCAHVWFQEPLQINKEQFNNALSLDVQEPAPLPVKYKRHKVGYAYIFLLIVILVACGALEVLKKPEKFPMIAEKINLPDYNGIRFHNFTVDSEIVDNKLDFYLKGTIINTNDRKMKIPVVKIAIYSKGGRKMSENKLAVPKEFIGPFEQLAITPELTGISGNAEVLELSFENWAEAALR